MSVSLATDLVSDLKKLTLLNPTQLEAVTRILPKLSTEARALTNELIRRGWLTAYQSALLLQGRGEKLVLGPFLLLDRIGEGGMGQVFKARHRGLQRVVALKVLRPELVHDSEAVARFYREIEVASQLPPHPNLVRVYDAGPVGPTHFLAMEFVEGCDLQRLVNEQGPLPVEQACDCLRQAAMGLQHAHERGLVHRDIKPANLFVDRSCAHQVVKVLDLGLARLQSEAGGGRENTLLTSDGPVSMGTVDYQAPEQALDFHRADVRADIYSLGCTFFYLLTGRPPYGGAPLAVKLMRHQQAEPPDLKERRPEVPEGLVPIFKRMIAKKPENRYQTPGELVAALGALGQPPRRRFHLALLAGVAGMGFLLLALGSLLFLRSPAPRPVAVSNIVEATQPLSLPPPLPDSVEATVPEARDYQLVYDLNLAKLAHDIVYDEDFHGKITQPFDRIAYFIELRRNDGDKQYLYVSMTAFTTDIKKVGVPALTTGAAFQMKVADMNVYSNVKGIVTGTGIAGGNIEFWPNNYAARNSKNVPNASSEKYDFGDEMTLPQDGYGSMQVHNHDARQTLFAVNHWRLGDKADIGIGNSPTGNPDWTFTGSAHIYSANRLRVLVHCK
jgi:serine/threonine protein kinase